MANVAAPKKEGGSNAGGMITGIIIVACLIVGTLVWKFLMGADKNFEGGPEPRPKTCNWPSAAR